MSLPSEIPFASFYQYSPRGTSDVSKQSRVLRDAVKRGQVYEATGTHPRQPAADRFATRIAQEAPHHPCLRAVLGPNRVLVPVPRSAPLFSEQSFWPSRVICQALLRAGLGCEVVCLLERTKAVQKSAFATAGQRADPLDHFRSTRIIEEAPALLSRKITLVDDFITRGSTFLGMYPHVIKAFPGCEVACFALVRTMSGVEVTSFTAPVEGVISNHGSLHRRP